MIFDLALLYLCFKNGNFTYLCMLQIAHAQNAHKIFKPIAMIAENRNASTSVCNSLLATAREFVLHTHNQVAKMLYSKITFFMHY